MAKKPGLAFNVEHIADCTHKGKQIMFSRDIHGKWYIMVDGVVTQKRLTAVELARWCANAMQDVPILVQRMSDIDLRIHSDVFLKQGKRIEAIKFVRQYREWGLREGLDYIKKSGYY